VSSMFLRPVDVASLCGVHSRTVDNWADAGKLKFARTPGGHRRFTAADVAAFLDAHGYSVPLALARMAGIEEELRA
jgi:excisionase family DNA binding protein